MAEEFVPIEAKPGNPYAEALHNLADALQTPDGLTPQQLCRQLGISPATLRRQRRALARLAELFGWEVGWILEEDMPRRLQLRDSAGFGRPREAPKPTPLRRFPRRGVPEAHPSAFRQKVNGR